MRCPQCGSNAIVQDKPLGKKVCTKCGLVLLEKKMSSKPEWHSEPGENGGRADVSSGSDITQHDLGLGSRMGYSRDLSPAWRSKLRRLKKWHRRSRATSYHDKSLRKALINLDKLCEDIFLPKSVKAEISALFRKAKKKEITMGRNTWSMLGALIFIVARMRRIPRMEREIATAVRKRAGIEQKRALKSIRRNRKTIAKELNLKVPRTRAKEYIDRFSTQINIPDKVRAEAHRLCNSLPQKFKVTKASFLVAAATIYNASRRFNGKVNIREIADELGVGVSSLSKMGQKTRELLPCFET